MAIMIAPPMPFLPAEAHGQPIVMVHLCYAGDAESGQKAIAPLRSIAEPLADMVRPMPYSGLFHAEQDGPEFPFAMANAVFTDTLTHEDVAHFLAQLNTSTAAMSVIQLRVLGGAMARVSAEATAFAHRSNRLMITGAAMYFDSAERPQHTAWIANVLAPVQGDQPRTYVGFLMNDDPDSVRTAYSAEGWQRLATIKQQVDPTNLFQLNYNIQPVAHEA